MLRISKLTDYAIVILSFLALDPIRVASATQIAEAVHLTSPTVSKLLKILLEAGLVKSYRGTGGGYQLAKSANHITLAEIVSAIEGNLAMTECCAPANNCAIDSLCAIKENWQVINNVILTALGGLTLHDMTRPLHGHPLMLRGIPIKVIGT
jgi:FeS assembly SUF system regulator